MVTTESARSTLPDVDLATELPCRPGTNRCPTSSPAEVRVRVRHEPAQRGGEHGTCYTFQVCRACADVGMTRIRSAHLRATLTGRPLYCREHDTLLCGDFDVTSLR